jgi:L-ascorbate peroxidase
MNIRSIARKPFFDFFFMGPIMPQVMRIALSDALTYKPGVNTSGPRAHFNFSKFRKLKANAGLNKQFKVIKEIKEEGNHVTDRLSLSDLIQIGGASAIEYSGGPYIEMKVGRVDLEDEHYAAEDTNIPHPDMNVAEIRSKYQAIGLDDSLIVALFGHRTLGFFSNYEDNREERWTRNPYTFDNNYYEELLDRNSPYIKTPSDLALVQDDEFRKWVEAYAADKDKFFENFALVYQKISELGYDNLLSEDTSYLKIQY